MGGVKTVLLVTRGWTHAWSPQAEGAWWNSPSSLSPPCAFVLLPVARSLTEPSDLRKTLTRWTRTQSSLPALCLPSPSHPLSFFSSHWLVCFLPNIHPVPFVFSCVRPVVHLLMFTWELHCSFCCIQASFVQFWLLYLIGFRYLLGNTLVISSWLRHL